MEFVPVIAKSDKAVFRLTANEETKSKYPCDFVLDISYMLRDNVVVVEYLVQNKDTRNMYFSIGAHPGFNCPLLPGEKFEEYVLGFDQDETIESLRTGNKHLSGKTTPFLYKSRS